jgi:hypothetical protein
MGYYHFFIYLFISVVDPHHVDADPDSTYHPDADPDSDFYLMRIRRQIGFLFDADPDPAFHPSADPYPDPDPSFQLKVQTLEKMLKQAHSIHFGLSSAN